MNLFRQNNRVSELKNDTNNDTAYFQHRRWQLVTLLEQLSGFWPHQNKLQQRFLQTIHFVILMSIFLAVANKTREFLRVDIDMTIECLVSLVFMFTLIFKLILVSTKQRKRLRVYEKIVEHFDVITDSEEAKVLEECTDQGFIYTLSYMCVVCFIVAVFDSIPVIRGLYNFFYLEEKLIIELPMQLDYGFNHSKYWYVIAVDFLAFVYSGVLVDFAYDLSFMLQIHYIKALFKIIGIRLNRASEHACDFENDAVTDDDTNESYSIIISAIDLHSECLAMIRMIEDAYTIGWFWILLLTTVIWGAGLHFMFTKLHSPIDTFQYGCVFFLFFIHYLIMFSQGQLIIDSSKTVAEACYDCKWYGLPLKSRKLLIMMMIRTSLSCELTGGKMFPLSIQTFGKMMKGGLSYYSVFEV